MNTRVLLPIALIQLALAGAAGTFACLLTLSPSFEKESPSLLPLYVGLLSGVAVAVMIIRTTPWLLSLKVWDAFKAWPAKRTYYKVAFCCAMLLLMLVPAIIGNIPELRTGMFGILMWAIFNMFTSALYLVFDTDHILNECRRETET